MRSAFQFHKGTIKTNFLLQALNTMTTFQFHKGTIKPLERMISTYVTLFQFHKGTFMELKSANYQGVDGSIVGLIVPLWN